MRSNLPLVWVVICRCFLSKKVVESGPTQTLRQEWPNGKLSFSCCIGLPSPFSIERMKAKLFSILYCNVELNFVSAFLLFSLETRNRTPHPTNSSTHWFLNSDEQHCMQIQTVEYLFEEDAMWGLYISSVCVKEYLSVQILWSFFKFSADVAEFDLHTVKLSSRAQAACVWAAPVSYLIFIPTSQQTDKLSVKMTQSEKWKWSSDVKFTGKKQRRNWKLCRIIQIFTHPLFSEFMRLIVQFQTHNIFSKLQTLLYELKIYGFVILF